MNTDQSSISSDESPDAAASSVDATSSTNPSTKNATKNSTVSKVGANKDVTPNSNEGITAKDAAVKGDKVTGGTAKELGGPKGLEPTRYGDWEKNGRCTDF